MGDELVRLASLFISSGVPWHSQLNCGSHSPSQTCGHSLGERPHAALVVQNYCTQQSEWDRLCREGGGLAGRGWCPQAPDLPIGLGVTRGCNNTFTQCDYMSCLEAGKWTKWAFGFPLRPQILHN